MVFLEDAFRPESVFSSFLRAKIEQSIFDLITFVFWNFKNSDKHDFWSRS